MNKLPSVTIIILNWEGWQDTNECLESLFKNTYANYHTIIIDNGSKDNSILEIKKNLKANRKINGFIELKESILKKNNFLTNKSNIEKEKQVFLIKNRSNYGFAKGNNIGIDFAINNLNPKYILLLNNDTIVDKNFLKSLVKEIEKKEDIGIVGPKIYYYDFNGNKNIINFTGGKINIWTSIHSHIGNNKIDNGQFNKNLKVDYVQGCCLLIRTDLLKKIGYLDEKFFAYWEETDLCKRAEEEQYICKYVYKSKIWHKVPKSITSPFRIYYLNRNRFLFMKKNGNIFQKITFLLYFTFIIFPKFIINYSFIQRNVEILKKGLKGFKDGLRLFFSK